MQHLGRARIGQQARQRRQVGAAQRVEQDEFGPGRQLHERELRQIRAFAQEFRVERDVGDALEALARGGELGGVGNQGGCGHVDSGLGVQYGCRSKPNGYNRPIERALSTMPPEGAPWPC